MTKYTLHLPNEKLISWERRGYKKEATDFSLREGPKLFKET